MSQELDPLLRALAEVERDDQARYPHAWEAAVAGRRPAAEVAAERAAIDLPHEHATFVAMFSRPVEDAEVDGLIERMGALARTRPGGRIPVVPGVTTPLANGGAVATPGARLRLAPAVPRWRRRGTLAVAAALAIAAAVVLWRLPAAGPRGERVAYSLTVRNETVKTTRSTEPAAGPDRYRADSQIDWVFSPATPQGEAVELRVEARDADGRAQTLTPPSTRSPEGALRVRGRLGELLPLAPGRWQLRFVVGTAAALARDEGEVVRERLEIELLPPG